MKPRISMITLGVNDLETSIRFYQDGLGFPKMESTPDVAFFTLNGSWLGLYNRESLAEDATAREAVIVGSILSKCSINNLDAAAAIMKLTHMEY